MEDKQPRVSISFDSVKRPAPLERHTKGRLRCTACGNVSNHAGSVLHRRDCAWRLEQS